MSIAMCSVVYSEVYQLLFRIVSKHVWEIVNLQHQRTREISGYSSMEKKTKRITKKSKKVYHNYNIKLFYLQINVPIGETGHEDIGNNTRI